MGLDMYINGRRTYAGDPIKVPVEHAAAYEEARSHVARNFAKEGGGEEVELAYWRKHPNLHGYIVQTYAGGVDECQEIPLDEAKLLDILTATQELTLPETTGFFFGTSDGTEREDDKEKLEKVLAWLREPDPEGYVRTVFYGASW